MDEMLGRDAHTLLEELLQLDRQLFPQVRFRRVVLQEGENIFRERTRLSVASARALHISNTYSATRSDAHWFKSPDKPWFEVDCSFRVVNHQMQGIWRFKRKEAVAVTERQIMIGQHHRFLFRQSNVTSISSAPVPFLTLLTAVV